LLVIDEKVNADKRRFKKETKKILDFNFEILYVYPNLSA